MPSAALLCFAVAEIRLPHHVQTHDGYAPDDGVHSAAFDGPVVQLLGCERCRALSRRGLGNQRQADDERGCSFVILRSPHSVLLRLLLFQLLQFLFHHHLFLLLAQLGKQERNL